MTHVGTETILARRQGVLAQRLDEEIVLLDADVGHYFALNPTGASLWEWIGEQTIRVADLVDLLCAHYDVSASAAERDILALVRELLEQGLVEVRTGPESL